MAFDGSDYCGWQIQPNDLSVQECIESNLSKISGQKISIVGCGRTDAKVHASSYYFHCDILDRTAELDLIYKLNRMCPASIAFKEFQVVNDDFHARFDAKLRSYTYYVSAIKDPFHKSYHWGANEKIDIDKLNEAASVLLDYEEFFPFCKTNSDVHHYRCQLSRSEWIQSNENKFEFHISANRFLRGMVRLIVGMLIRVGEGRIPLEDVIDALHKKQHLEKAYSAPACGLFLEEIVY